MVLRSQAGSIAEEVVSHLQLDPEGRVVVLVEGGTVPVIVENALVESLKRRVRSVKAASSDHVGEKLNVIVLRQDVRYRAMQSERYERVTETAVEVSHAFSPDGSRTVSRLDRSAVDTVDAIEDLKIGLRSIDRSSDVSFFERLIGPAILIAGTVIAVYLLFTVRS